MMAGLLTTASKLQCPHGGQVRITTSNDRAKAAGTALVRASDTFSISGCPFPSSGPPHPCVRVKWVMPALRGKALREALLTRDSVGLCVAADDAPQGTVLILSTQARVDGL